MTKAIKEKYRATTIDEILALIEVDKKKYKANERITKKDLKRHIPLFWKKEYIYAVEYTSTDKDEYRNYQKVEPVVDEQQMILDMLEIESSHKEDIRETPSSIEEGASPAVDVADIMEEPPTGELPNVELVTEESKLNEALIEEYVELLKEAEIKDELVEGLVKRIKDRLSPADYEDKEKLGRAFEDELIQSMGETTSFNLLEARRMVLVGPTGVGKTTTIAKLAGLLILEGKKVGLITTDVYRMGAPAQLKEYADILNLSMEKVETPEELEQALLYFENVEKVDHVLIDTVGKSPMDAGNIEVIKSFLDVINAEHASLVVSCTQKEKDVYRIIENFKTANINSVIFTKLDETLNHGTLVNVLADRKTNISFLTNGQEVPQDIYVADTRSIAKKILQGVDSFERPSF